MLRRLKKSFHGSETIVWARVQLVVGSVWLGLSQADLAPLLRDPKYITYWLIFNGIITELLRRCRANDLR